MSSKPIVRHNGYIENGVVYYHNIDLYNRKIQSLEGKKISVTIEEYREKATKDQFGFLFGGIIPTALEHECYAGWEKRELVNHFENEFLMEPVRKFKKINNKEVACPIWIARKVSELDTKEMTIFIEKIIARLAEEGIVVLSPDEYKTKKYGKH